MKIFARIVSIVVVFSIVAALIVIFVNISGMNAHALDDTTQFRPQGNPNSGELRPPINGNRPERGEKGPSGVTRLMFDMIQNVVIIGFLVIMIVWPKSIAKKKKANSIVIENRKL